MRSVLQSVSPTTSEQTFTTGLTEDTRKFYPSVVMIQNDSDKNLWIKIVADSEARAAISFPDSFQYLPVKSGAVYAIDSLVGNNTLYYKVLSSATGEVYITMTDFIEVITY
jgi:hypothetical protein